MTSPPNVRYQYTATGVQNHRSGSNIEEMTIHIMVAGSNSRNVELARQAFDALDCQIIPAPTMSLALFLAQKNLPDIILCGFEMVDGDGLSFIKEIKADEELRQLPFVFMATANDQAASEKALDLGADAVLKHPLETDQLKREVIPYINIRVAEKNNATLKLQNR